MLLRSLCTWSHTGAAVTGKKQTSNQHRTLLCAQESVLLPSTKCCAVTHNVVFPMLHTLSFCNAVVQLDVMSTPNKGYFKGNIWEVQLAAAPVPVLVSDTLAGFPRNTQQARGTVAAMLQDVNLPVLLPTSALFRASPASCSEPNKGLPEVDFMREVKYALLSLGL